MSSRGLDDFHDTAVLIENRQYSAVFHTVFVPLFISARMISVQCVSNLSKKIYIDYALEVFDPKLYQKILWVKCALRIQV